MLDKLNTVYRDMANAHFTQFRRFESEENIIKHIVVYLLSSSCNCNLWGLMEKLNEDNFNKLESSPILEFTSP